MSGWHSSTLGEVCETITDGAHNSPKSVISGKPMASVKDLTFFGVDLSDAREISEIDFKKLVDQGCKPHVGDVLIAKDGNSALDTVCSVDEELGAVLLSSVAILRPDREKVTTDFLKYYFRSPQTIYYLKSNFISGAAIPRVVLKDFRRAEIFLPEISEQKRITNSLRSLDDKIALNRKLNETLEGLARALFQSWFVDFDPVKAKVAAVGHGRDPERACIAALSGKLRIQPGKPKPDILNVQLPTAESIDAAIKELDLLTGTQQQTLAQTALYFPASFQESELGLVPEGWEVSFSGEHLDVMRGFSYKGAGLAKEGIPMHNLNSVYEGGGYKYEGIKRYTLPFKDKHRIKPGDVIVTNTEQGFDHLLIGFGALVPESFPEGIFSHHIYRVRPKGKSPLTNHFIYHLFLPGRFRSAVAGFSNGTTVNMLPIDGLTKQLLCIPASALISEFTARSKDLRKQQEKLHHQSRTLAELRDTLLPKLLSGEISVNKVSETVEAAVGS